MISPWLFFDLSIPMMDAVYDALRAELADQQENGFNETEIDGMKGLAI